MPDPDDASSPAAPAAPATDDTLSTEPAGAWPTFLIFLRLGLTSFGGPVAHLGYFREAFVVRRRWLDDAAYADLVALCQFLPGPASSQVGMGLGLMRAGYAGAFAAWLGFTAPSAIAMIAAGYGVLFLGGSLDTGWLAGLKLAAVAVVAQAVLGMAKTLCPDRLRASLAVAAAVVLLMVQTPWAQVAVIAAGAAVGLSFIRPEVRAGGDLHVPVGRRSAFLALGAFFLLLVCLPVAAHEVPLAPLAIVDIFYRSGALVFGGGHVVLPLLQAEVVPTGLVGADTFLAGYGAAQAVPGPLFTFAGYLGTVLVPPGDAAAGGWPVGLIALVAIFLPAFLLVVGALPFWAALRRRPKAQAALAGVNAAVVGVLGAALYDPVWTAAVKGPADLALAIAAFALLQFWKLPPWLVVALSALAGFGLARLA